MLFSELNLTFTCFTKLFFCNKHLCVKELTKQKVVLKFAAVVVSLGNKKEQVVLVKVVFVLHNGKAAVSYSDQLLVAMVTNYLRKVRRLAIKSALSSKVIDNDIDRIGSTSIEHT